ncbi:WXG100-like domain-containing protein [Streptosporangium pseudovulgare]|uniref:Outer membrane channel protein CpnT-like N-terminal domain-containing protein n=1 Tax=Streptosporangium pseudovulgare TaxID=35765 RepID=A0ABQ2QUL0_9ACTN|nr:hypothetical protein [Streptosporangium pseudovulgare]GGP98297.1 hypothetical protein GCM10010140_30630 [Streptosporangium pseudovulgare]
MAVNTDSAGSRTGINPSAAGGTPPDVVGGAAPDVTPAWGESLPAWANTLISYLASGQNWPEASERLMWQIATANRELYEGLVTSVESGVTAGGMILQSWTGPASKKFAEDFAQAYSQDSGVPVLAQQAAAYFQQADNFAREVQYSKISINVAFWIAVIATYIALLAAFFSAGATTSALGPIAAAARSNIGRILERLAVVAGRTPEGAVTRLAARGAATNGVTAAGGAAHGLRTLLTGAAGREVTEEMGEEGAIDYLTQKKQMDMGTRTSRDWQRFLASLVGAAGGAVIGMKAAPMLNRFSSSMPVLRRLNEFGGTDPGIMNAVKRFPARAVQTGLNNMVASPGGSIIANTLVYRQNPLEALPNGEALLGAALGGAGRTNTISPFNPDVFKAITHLRATLDSGAAIAAASDARLAGGDPPAGSGGPAVTPGNQPDPGSGGTSLANAPAPDPAPDLATVAAAGNGGNSGHVGNSGNGGNGPNQSGVPAGNGQATGGAQNPQATGTVPVAPVAHTAPGAGTTPAGSPAHTSVSPATAPSSPAPASGTAPSGSSGTGPNTPSTSHAPQAGAPAAQSGQGASTAAQGPQGPATAQGAQGTPAAQGSQAAQGPQGTPAAQSGEEASAARGSQGPQSPQGSHNAPQGAPESQSSQGAPNTAAAPGSANTAAAPDPANTAAAQNPAAAPGSAPGSANTAAAPDPAGAPVTPSAPTPSVPGGAQESAPGAGTVTTAAGTPNAVVAPGTAQAGTTAGANAPATGGETAPGTSQTAQVVPAAPQTAPGTSTRAATSAPATAGPDAAAALRLADSVLAETVRIVAPTATLLNDGRIRLAREDGQVLHIPADAVRFVGRQLTTRVHDGVGRQRLTAEAAAWLGIEVARTLGEGGREGAVLALHQLVEASPELSDAATQVAVEILMDNPADGGIDGSNPDAGRFAEEVAERAKEPARAPVDEYAELRATAMSREVGALLQQVTTSGQAGAPAGTATAEPGQEVLPPAELSVRLQRLAETVAKAETALEERAKAWSGRAKAAREDADSTLEKVEAAEKAEREGKPLRGERDSRAQERRRQARESAKAGREAAAMDSRVAARYRTARTRAVAARAALAEAADALNRLAGEREGSPTAAGLSAEAARLAGNAQDAFDRYLDAMKEALPPEAVRSATFAAGPLPHMAALTDAVNKLLADQRIDHEFSPAELEDRLRAEFRRMMSTDGAVLRLETGKGAELVIRMEVEDLVEVLDPEVTHSETMLGWLTQGNRSASAGAGRSAGTSVGADVPGLVGNLLGLLPGAGPALAMVKGLAKRLGLDVGYGREQGSSQSVNGSRYVLGGGVLDNRGPAAKYQAGKVKFTAGLDAPGMSGRVTVQVTEGAPGDGTTAELWVSHAHIEPAPEKTAQRDFAEGHRPTLPGLQVIHVAGLEEAIDEVEVSLADRGAGVGSMIHHEIRTALAEEVASRLPEVVNNPGGLSRPIAGASGITLDVEGDLKVRRAGQGRFTVDAEMVGTATSQQLGEELGVGFVSISDGQGVNQSRNVNLTVGGKFADHVPFLDIDAKGLSGKLSGSGSRGVSRSEGVNANGTGILPLVGRKKDHNETCVFDVITTITVRVPGESEPRRLGPITLTVTAQMTESDAYKAYFPVDEAAVTRDEDAVTLRDDVLPEAPPGRRNRPADWEGEGPGRVRSVGFAHVELMDDITGLREQAETYLRGLDLLPGPDGEVSKDEVRAAGQRDNQRALDETLSKSRLQTEYGNRVLYLPVVDQRKGRQPQHSTLRIQVNRGWRTRIYAGHTPGRPVVSLFIGSDTSGSSSGGSGSLSGNVGVGAGYGTADGESKISGGAGHGRSMGRGSGESRGFTTNDVYLVENLTSTALTDEVDTVTIDHLTGDTSHRVASDQVRVRQKLPADLLPAAGSAMPATGMPSSEELLDVSVPLALDLGRDADAAPGRNAEIAEEIARKAGIQPGTLAFQAVTGFLSTLNLLTHPDFLHTPHEIEFTVDPDGPSPRRWSLTIGARLGDSTFVGESDLVDSPLNLSLTSHGATTGKQSGRTTDGSVSGGLSQAEDPTTGGDANGSAGKNTSSEVMDLGIGGNEVLPIRTGPKDVFRADLETVITLAEVGTDNSVTMRTTDGTYMYGVPLRDGLRAYAEGRASLPLDYVADVVERYLYGHVTLGRDVQAPLVQRYLKDLAAARRSGVKVPLADEHTPRALLDRMMQLFGNHDEELRREADPGRRLAKLLAKERDRIADPEKVRLADSVRERMGQSWPERVVLRTEDGTRTDVHHAILRAVEEYAPGALAANSALRRRLFGDFAGKRWWGKIINMLGQNGHAQSQPLTDEARRGLQIPIRLKMRIDGEDVVLLAHVSEDGIIVQGYDYEEKAVTETVTRSLGGGVGGNGSVGVSGISVGTSGSLSTGRSRSESTTRGEQWTWMERIASFNGMEKVRHGFEITIEVGDGQAAQGTRPPVTVTLNGEMTRFVPTELVETEENGPVEPDPRPVRLPQLFKVDNLQLDGLPTAVQEVLADKRLLGAENARAVLPMLEQNLSRLRQTGHLRALLEGRATTLRLRHPDHPRRFVDVTVRARPKDVRVTVTGRHNTELGRVHRIQRIISRSFAYTRRFSLSRVRRFFGLSRTRTNGWQVSFSSSYSGGNRNETSVFEKGTAASAEVPLVLDVTAETKIVKRNRAVKIRARVDAPNAATGMAEVTLFERDLRALEAQRGTEGRRRWGWRFGDPEVTRTAERPGWRARWRNGAPAAAPGFDLNELAAEISDRSLTAVETEREMTAAARRRLPEGWRPGTPVRITARADAPGRLGQVTAARLLAQSLATDVYVEIRDPGGAVRGHYRATREGELSSAVLDGTRPRAMPDGGFASAFATLPAALVRQADEAGIDLRVLYNGSPDNGDFAARVRERLSPVGETGGRPGTSQETQETEEAGSPRPSGGTYQGAAAGSQPGGAGGSVQGGGFAAMASQIPGTTFTVDSRPPHLPSLTREEIRQVMAAVHPSVLGPDVVNVSWSADGSTMAVETRNRGVLHIRFDIGRPRRWMTWDRVSGMPSLTFGRSGRVMARTRIRSGTAEAPHRVLVTSRPHPRVVTRIVIHELSHIRQRVAAADRLADSRAFRRALARVSETATQDHCVQARYDEHRELGRQWRAARTADDRLYYEHEIKGVAQAIWEHGHVPPVPPWEAGTPAEPGFGLDALLNRPATPSTTEETKDAYWARMRRLTNSTGWIPPENEECVCPPTGPCVCGRRSRTPGDGTSPVPSPRASSPAPSEGTAPGPGEPEDPRPRDGGDTPVTGRRVKVSRDTSLWALAERYYGEGRHWKVIWERNREVIGDDPGMLRAGMTITVPDLPRKAGRAG